MRILIITEAGKGKVVDKGMIPRVGDKIDMFYQPFPEVSSVLLWPSIERLNEIGFSENIEAIITVR